MKAGPSLRRLSVRQRSGGQIGGLLAVLLTEGVFPFMRAADFIPPSLALNAALGRWVPPEQTCLHLTRGNREALKGQFTIQLSGLCDLFVWLEERTNIKKE